MPYKKEIKTIRNDFTDKQKDKQTNKEANIDDGKCVSGGLWPLTVMTRWLQVQGVTMSETYTEHISR